MNLKDFKELFTNSKNSMTLTKAADYIHEMRNDHYPLMCKSCTLNRLVYNHRLASNTACVELETAIRNAAPWEDYREIFADYIWPYMQRVLKHIENRQYDGLYGEKIGVGDAWTSEMWFAYDEIFRKMPGNIPNNTQWIMLDSLIRQAEQKTRKFRRKL